MKITWQTAKNGMTTAEVDGSYIHSPYDPQKEAQKIVDSQWNQQKRLTLIIGYGLGYYHKAAVEKNPSGTVISISFNKELTNKSVINSGIVLNGEDLYEMTDALEQLIDDSAFLSLQIIRIKAHYKKEAELMDRAEKNLLLIFNRLNANITTTRFFGKLWFRNILRNMIQGKPLSVFTLTKPLVITAPGLSLEKNIDLLKRARNRIHIAALSSSISFCLHHQIRPDFIIHTDPGYYSQYHLTAFHSSGKYNLSDDNLSPPLFIGASQARVPVWIKSFYFFTTGSALENFILSILSENKKIIQIPAHGTVSGSALHLAEQLSPPAVIFTGLDLQPENSGRSHVRPYGLDYYWENNGNRLNNSFSIYWKRFLNMHSLQNGEYVSRSMATYQQWFEKYKSSHHNLYRLSDDNKSFPSIKNISKDDFEKLIKPADQSISENISTIQNQELNSIISAEDQNTQISMVLNKLREIIEIHNPDDVFKSSRSYLDGNIERHKALLLEQLYSYLNFSGWQNYLNFRETKSEFLKTTLIKISEIQETLS